VVKSFSWFGIIFGLGFAAFGLVFVAIAVNDNLSGWVDAHSSSGCTYSTGACSDDVVLTFSFVGGSFIVAGLLTAFLSWYIPKRTTRWFNSFANGATSPVNLTSEKGVYELLHQMGIQIDPAKAQTVVANPVTVTSPPSVTTIEHGQVIDEAAIRAKGRSEQATLVSAKSMGVTVGDRILMELDLSISPAGGTPYSVSHHTMVDTDIAAFLQPGAALQVHVDPDIKERVAVDWEAPPPKAVF
jgi:hypothetical protein